MRLFGLDISIKRIRTKALQGLQAAGSWFRVFDFTGGYFQADDAQINEVSVSRNWAVFACVTLIAGDIAKMAAAVMQFDRATQVYTATLMRAVLRKPNRFQTRIEFFKMWVFSLLFQGNTYVLLKRDPATGFVDEMFILDPCKVTPLVNPETGDVFYQLTPDNMSMVTETVTVPASEIIHDRINTIWHPLIGVSPLYACAVAATQGSAIMNNSSKFFENMSRPSGILSAPGEIAPDTANRIKELWETKFQGDNAGRVAVLGDDMKYHPLSMSAEDSQLIEQLKFSGEQICATFHVPPYKLGLGQMPTVNNVSALNQQYYDQALQPLVENMELRLAEGLDVIFPFEVWMDESALLRMDPETRQKSHSEAIKGGWYMPNEARRVENLAPVEGGDTPYMQIQNYSLAALARRDSQEAPVTEGAPKNNDGEEKALSGVALRECATQYLWNVLEQDLATG